MILRFLMLGVAILLVGCASNNSIRQVGDNAKELGRAFETDTGKALDSGNSIIRRTSEDRNKIWASDDSDNSDDTDRDEN